MAFDLATAKPVAAPASAGGFDLATARPVGGIPDNAVFPEADPVRIYETDPNTGAKTSRLQYPSGTRPRQTATEKQADLDNEARLRAEDTALPQSQTALGKLVGSVEPLVTVGSGMVGTVLGNLYGIGKSAVQGKYGTAEGVRDAKKTADEVAGAMTYQPRTDSGKAGVAGIAKLASHAEGLQGVGPVDAGMLLGAARTGVSNVRNIAGANAAALGAEEAAQVSGNTGKLIDLVRKPKPAMQGVGAAATDAAALRVANADQLPVPMGRLMTKGMRTRDKADLAFENIAAKDPETGKGLRNRTVEVNQAALDNFDAFADSTGAQGSGLRPTGKVVNDYLVKRVGKAKSEIRQAYNEAAESVEGKTPAQYQPLKDYLEKYAAEAETGNAPVINAVKRSLEKLDPEGTGAIPLKDYNEIREMVGRISKDGTPNAAYRQQLQTFVDDAVEANGGPLYRSARRAYENYQNEFKNAGAIDRLLRTKPGTKDRATALEDVVTKSTLDAPSTDAVRQMKSTLTRKQDAEGLQAWKEVQGETARQIKERVTKASTLNEGGAREVSPAVLDKVVRELDADGRLDVIFSKKGAQQWRDLRDAVLDMKTVPAGTVSSSGTAEVLAGLLDTTVSAFTGAPLPIASALNYGVKRVKKGQKLKKIDAALNPDGGQ